MISVVIPLYNKEKQIADTLQSVLMQSFQDFEIVVVNDGSTDDSVKAAESVDDSRIRIIHQKNAGVSAARNRGIEEAKYDFIAFLDADDRWKPDYLQTQYELSQKYPECSVFACNYEFVHADGIHPTIIRKLPFDGPDGILSNYFEVASNSHPPLWTSAVIVKKEAILAIGGFPAGIQWGEDLLAWARLAYNYNIAYSASVLSSYIFEATHTSGKLPSDILEVPDYVGRELIKMYSNTRTSPLKNQLQGYASFWFKMRAHINIVWGNNKAARHNAFYSIKYDYSNIKAWLILGLSLFPSWLLRIGLTSKR